MSTKTKTPEELREEADRLALAAAEAQAKVNAAAEEQRQREWQAQLEADQQFVDSFNRAELDQAVEDAREALDKAVAELPVTKAMAAFLAAQYRRNWAYGDLSAARARLDLPTAGTRQSSTVEVSLADLVTTVARRDAQQQIDTDRTNAE